MNWKPRLYQLIAICFMLRTKQGALFLDAGLGKTSTTLSVCRILLSLGRTKGILIVAPLRVCDLVWPLEIQKWERFKGMSHVFLHGKNKNKAELFGGSKDIYLINPEGLKWLYSCLLEGLQDGEKCPFDMLVVDESTYFKNPTSKNRFLLLKDLVVLFKRRYILTGTPSPSGLMNLWSQIYILDKGKSLGNNFYKFRNRYFHKLENSEYNWVMKPDSEKLIKDAIAPICLNMSASEHLEMPPILFNDICVRMPPKARKIYTTMENECFAEIDSATITADAAAQSVMKCQQIANGRVYDDIDRVLLSDEEIKAALKNRKVHKIHSAKQDALAALVEELQDKPLLVAYKFKHDLSAIKEALGDIPYIGSGVSARKTLEILKDWNDGKIPVLAGQPSSMGHGLNMQAVGRDICWYSLDHSLELTLQFNARIYRQGVSGSVTIHRLVCEGTVDHMILRTLARKDKTQTSLREAISLYRNPCPES